MNISNKIKILYNSSYIENDRNNSIDINNISLETVKFKYKNKHIKKIYKELFKGKIKFYNFLPHNNTVILNKNGILPYTFFISPYKNKKDKDSKKSKENNDSIISYILANMVINGTSPNILLPLLSFDMNIDLLDNILIPIDPFFNGYSEKLKLKNYSDIVSVRVKENYSKKISLKSYMDNHSKTKKYDIKPILFQIIHTLYNVNNMYPNFKHNNLTSDTIYLVNNDKKFKSFTYKFNNNNYTIKFKNNMVKIGHFDNSYLNSKIKSHTNIIKGRNEYFDLHYFLNTLLIKNKLDLHKIKHPNKFRNFINDILPKKYRGSLRNKYYLNKNIVHMTLKKILKHKYFNDMIDKSKKLEDSIEFNIMSDNSSFLGNQNSDIINGGDIKKCKNNCGRNAFRDYDTCCIACDGKGKHTKKCNKFYNKINSNSPKNNNNYKQKDSSNSETFRKENSEISDSPRKENSEISDSPRKENSEISDSPRKEKFKKKKFNKNKKKVSFKEPYEHKKTDKFKNYKKGYDPLDRNKKNKNSFPLPIIKQSKYNYQDYAKYPYNLNNIPKIPIQNIYSINQSETHLGDDTITKAFIEIFPGRYKPLEFNMIKNRKILNNTLYGLIDMKKVDNVLNLSTNIIGNNWREFLLVDKPNPYGTEDASNKDLPKNFYSHLAYWPISVDKTNKVRPAKNAQLFHLRCYNLSYSAFREPIVVPNITNGVIYKFQLDVFREQAYYKYVTENIVNKNISPNFVAYIIETLDYKSKINYKTLFENQIKNINTKVKKFLDDNKNDIGKTLTTFRPFIEYLRARNIFNYDDLFMNRKNPTEFEKAWLNFYNSFKKDDDGIVKQIKFLIEIIDMKPNNSTQLKLKEKLIDLFDMLGSTPNDKEDKINKISKLLYLLGNKNINLKEYPDCSLIMLTEAPTYNIYKWASPLYKQDGSHLNMIQSGIHTDDEWKNILFQIIHIFSVLFEHNIYLRELSLKRNFFIKNINNFKNRGVWCYIIDGIKFYLPNMGYMVLFDSSYTDIGYNYTDLFGINSIKEINTPREKGQYKHILGNIFNKDIIQDINYKGSDRKDKIKKAIITRLYKVLTTFSTNVMLNSIYKLPHNIIELINRIKIDLEKIGNNVSIMKEYITKTVFLKHFNEYLSKQIGIVLTEDENKHVGNNPLTDKDKGTIQIYDTGNVKQFILYIDKDEKNSYKSIIVIKNKDNKYIFKSVFTAMIKTYPYILNNDESNIIETYSHKSI